MLRTLAFSVLTMAFVPCTARAWSESGAFHVGGEAGQVATLDSVELEGVGLRVKSAGRAPIERTAQLVVIAVQLGTSAHAAGLYPGDIIEGLGGSPELAASTMAATGRGAGVTVRATNPNDTGPHSATLYKYVDSELAWVTALSSPLRAFGVRRPIPGVIYGFDVRAEFERREAAAFSAIEAAPCEFTADRRRALLVPLLPLATLRFSDEGDRLANYSEWYMNNLEERMATRATAGCEVKGGSGLSVFEATVLAITQDALDPCEVLSGKANAAVVARTQRTWSVSQYHEYIENQLLRFRNGRGLSNEERDGRKLNPVTGRRYTAQDGSERMRCFSKLLLEGVAGRR